MVNKMSLRNNRVSRALSALVLTAAALAPLTSAQAGKPMTYGVVVGSSQDFNGEEKNAFESVILNYFVKDLTKAFQEVEAENEIGLQGIPDREKPKDNPLPYVMRTLQLFDGPFKAHLEHLRGEMNRRAQKGDLRFTDDVTGITGPIPFNNTGTTGKSSKFSADFKLDIVPLAPGVRIGDEKNPQKPLLSAPAGGSLAFLEKIPFMLANIKDVVVAPFTKEWEDKSRDARWAGFQLAAEQQGKGAIANALPKGVTLRVHLEPTNSYVYMNILLSVSQNFKHELKMDADKDGVHTREFEYHVTSGEGVLDQQSTSVVQLTFVSQLPGMQRVTSPPYVAITFGALEKPRKAKDSIFSAVGVEDLMLDLRLPPVAGREDLRVGRFNALNDLRVPYITGFLDSDVVIPKKFRNPLEGLFSWFNKEHQNNLGNKIPFTLFIERMIVALAPWRELSGITHPAFTIMSEIPFSPLDYDAKDIKKLKNTPLRTLFRYSSEWAPREVPLMPQSFANKITDENVLPPINKKIQSAILNTMLKDYTTDHGAVK